MEMLQLCLDHEGEPMYGAYGTVPATWECQKSINRCEVFAVGKALENAGFPLTILTDHRSVVQGLRKETVHYTSENNHTAEEWKKIYQAPRKIEQDAGLEKQFVLSYAEARVTGEGRKQTKDKTKFNTTGSEQSRRPSQTG